MMETCGLMRKHKHPNRRKAEAQRKSLIDRNLADDTPEFRAYFCKYCRTWHVGHVKEFATTK